MEFPAAADNHATARPGSTGVTETTDVDPAEPDETSVSADTRNQCCEPFCRPFTVNVVPADPVFGVRTE